MLTEILKNNQCFKLVCGAGNEDMKEVEKLVALYSKAGCNFFDLCAKPEIVEAAKRGLEIAGIKRNRYLCVSLGIKGDPHANKALIDEKKCSSCGKCAKICPQGAIFKSEDLSYKVNKIRCIGCEKCVSVCPNSAFGLYSEAKNPKDVLPEIVKQGIDCIEYHALIADEKEVYDKWDEINQIYDGFLSICIDRSKLGNEGMLNRVKRMIKDRAPYTTIVQADGCPMSGGADDYKTTLQAVAMAEIFQNADLPVYILLSGGTNSKTSELAAQCGIHPSGVAIGSFARKIVKEYINRDDFLNNEEVFNKALVIAKNLVDTTLKNLR
ncbi:MAG: LdpA C-terminal domain-containing domain [Cyanobacteriota bacterium]|nr:LdpA C-terminal domain-containing domain [Cyanobacteriota bacterium]MDY6359092.1 LdpA C-terminal domain-containing domain [Cyanobacteriota bacterium]MDY6383231.1 LdpA C-terminal domain-containing domain [Cyanobacteriota bacterium]